MVLLGPALALWLLAGGPEDLADRLAADDDPLVLGQGLGEVGVVEVAVKLIMEGQDDRGGLRWQGIVDGASPVAVAQAGQPGFLPPFVDPFGLSVADPHDLGRFFQGQGLLVNLFQYVAPVGFFPAQDDRSLHAGHLHEGDIFALQLEGTKSYC